MKLKKLLAAVLSTALILPILPQSLAVQAADEYLINQTFDYDSVSDVPSAYTSQQATYWARSIETEADGNKYLKMTRTSATTSSHYNLLISSLEKTVSLNQNDSFEFGYSYKTDLTKDAINQLFNIGMPASMNHQYGVFSITPTGFSKATYTKTSSNDEFTHVKIIYEGGTGVVYCSVTDENGTETEVIKTTGRTQSFNIQSACYVQLLNPAYQSNVAGDSISFDNIYLKKISTRTVTFDTMGGNAYGPKTTIFGTVNISEEPTKTKAVFDGWYYDKNVWEQPFDGTGVNSDITVYAKWIPIYTVTFETNGGEAVDPIDTIEATVDEIPVTTKFRNEFAGWYTDPELTTPWNGEVGMDRTVYAKWIEAKEIAFESNGGSEIDPVYVSDALSPDEFPTPEWEGYRFDGWFRDEAGQIPFDGKLLTEEEEIAGAQKQDITVYAMWTKMLKINFEPNGGSQPDVVYTLEDMAKADLPVSTAKGLGFDGWYWDETLENPFDGSGIEDFIANNESREITVYAAWNNILYQEDFQTTTADGSEWIKQTAPADWQDYMENGWGIVEDPDGKGNKAYRMAYNRMCTGNYIPLPNGDAGEGLYEISYKMLVDKTVVDTGQIDYMWDIFSPYYGGKEIVAVRSMQAITLQSPLTVLHATNLSSAWGWVEVTYWVDTLKGNFSAFVTIEDAFGRKTTTETYNVANDALAAAPGIDGIGIPTGSSHLILTRGTNFYFDDIVVKKIDPPKITDISITEGQQDVNLDTTYQITFSELMDWTTLTNANIYVTDSDGNKITGAVKSVDEDGKTISTLTLNKKLEYDKDYKLVVTVSVRSAQTYFLDNSYERNFHTRPEKFQVETTLTSGGNAVESLADFKSGSVLTAKLNLRNYAGDATEPYFVAAALIDGDGRQLAYKSAGGSLALSGENMGTDVLSAVFVVPQDLDEDCKVKFYVWNSMSDRDIIWDVIEMP